MSKLSPGTPLQNRAEGMSSAQTSSPQSMRNSSYSSPSSQSFDFSSNDLQIRMNLLQTKHNKEMENLRDELDRSRQDNIEKSEKLAKIELEKDEKINEQQRLITETSRQKIQLQTQIESFLSQISSKFGQNVKSLKDASLIFSNIAAESGSSRDSLMSLQQMHDEVQENFENLSTKLAETKRENKKLRSALKQASQKLQTVPDPEEIVQPYEAKINELNLNNEKTKEKLQQEINEKDEKIKQLKQNISEIRAQQKAANQQDSEKQVLDAQNKLLKEKLQISQEENERSSNEIEKLKAEVANKEEELREVKDQLSIAQSELDDREQMIYKTLENKDDLKKKNEIVKDAVRSIDAELAAAQSRVTELELQLTMCQEENKKLKVQLEAPKTIVHDKREEKHQEDMDMILESVDRFEDVIKAQRDEIMALSKARTDLVSALHKSMSSLEAVEKAYEESQQHIQQLQEANQDMKEKMADEQVKDDQYFNKSFEKILEIVPKDLIDDISELSGMKKGDILVKVVEILATSKEGKVLDSKEYEALQTKCKAILANLANCSKFISKLTKTPVVVNEEGRAEIMSQCMRISRYIDEQSASLPTPEFSRPSLFEPEDINNPERIAKIFFDFVGDEAIDQTPYVELYTLFCCLAQVNMMLMDAINQHKQAASDIVALQMYNQGLNNKLQEANEFREQVENERLQLTPVLSKFFTDPPEEFPDLVQKFCVAIKDGPLSTEQGNKLKDALKEADRRYEELKEQMSSEREAMEAEKNLFCQKANNIVATIEAEVVKQNTEKDSKIAEVTEELINTKAENERLKNDLNNLTENYKNEKQELEEELKESKDSLEATTQQLRQTQEQLNDAKSEALNAKHEAEETQQKTDNDIKLIIAKLQRETQRKLRYKERATAAEQQNANTIADVKKRTDSLAEQYGASISQLQEELSESRARIQEQEQIIAQMVPEKEKILRELAKMKIAERTASIKVGDLQSALEQERNNNAAKLDSATIAQKQAIENTKKEYEGKLQVFRKLVYSILNDNKLMKLSDNELVETALPRINELIANPDSRTTADAIRLRRSLQLSENDSLIDEFKRLYNNVYIAEENNKKMTSELAASVNEKERLARENKRLGQSKQELEEWIRWGRSVFRQIKETNATALNGSDIRFVIEEQILASLDFKSIVRKLDILRSEKRLLLTKDTVDTESPKLRSIRPLIAVAVFAKNLQNMSGCIPTPYCVRPPQEQPRRPIVPFN